MRTVPLLLAVACALACEGPRPSRETPPGAPAVLPAASQAELDALRAQLAATETLTADALTASRALPWRSALGYDPASAVNLTLVQASALKLDSDELAALTRDGFVISERKKYQTFFHAYRDIYSADLPVWVSADSILHAVHRSYDKMLLDLETGALIPELQALLQSMRARLQSGTGSGAPAQVRADVDVYLAVAASLLQEEDMAPVGDGNAALVGELVARARGASGTSRFTLFEDERDFDWSQMKPRGHYTQSPVTEAYFRAMMWLGRAELRLVRTQPEGSQVFQRPSLLGAVLLRELMDAAALGRWTRIDATLAAFIGERDSMAPPEVDELLAALGRGDVGSLGSLDDTALEKAVIEAGFGTQRICSQLMVNGIVGTLPLDRSFLLLGQRYTIDSHVFSNVTYDRVPQRPFRMMPDPLDVAYAALGNDQAVALLDAQLKQYPYAPALESMRILVDAHGASFWGENLYNAWLDALRTLSPNRGELADPAAAGLPAVAATERWGRRMLSAQLASWAELRHDTLLYTKQSYSGIPACEYPDAYVDPYPKFFAAVGALAARGQTVVDGFTEPAYEYIGSTVKPYLATLAGAAAKLQEMAEHQRTGMPHSAESLAFINRAVSLVPSGCTVRAEGWYTDLFYGGSGRDSLPTIADVHTQPADESGNPVGRVLHAATGTPRLMVATVETCSGPRVYVGPVSSYHEKVTQDFQRLTDQEWLTALSSATDVPWMTDVVVH